MGLGTPPVEDDREEDEPVKDAQQHDAQIHSEIVEPKESGLGEGEHQHPHELG